jgi:ribosome-associated heat shock protein Hsp15
MSDGHAPTLRIDKYLWFVRLAPNRSSAQALAERGIIRLNGRRVERAHVPVRVGDLITMPQGNSVRVIRIEQLPVRRGPFAEAQLCYSAITPGTATPPEA